MQTGFPAELKAPLQPLAEQLLIEPQVDCDGVSKEGKSWLSSNLQTYREWKTHTTRKVAAAARSVGVAVERACAAVEVAVLGLAVRILRIGR